MKTTIFLRLTKDGQVNATQTSKVEPLRDSRGKAKHTVFLSLQVNIPDEAFRPPNISASISVPIERVGTAVEVVDPLKICGGP
jgi:hypothetical protein